MRTVLRIVKFAFVVSLLLAGIYFFAGQVREAGGGVAHARDIEAR